jgi:hypothetical protein
MALALGRLTDLQQVAGKLADVANAVDFLTPNITALNTVGAGTITAAGIVSGVTARGGAQSGSAFTDTTDTAALIIAALTSPGVGQSWAWVYDNQTNAPATITGGSGVTMAGSSIVPANCWVEFVVKYTAAGAVSITSAEMGKNAELPTAQYVTAALQSATITNTQVAGAHTCYFENTGTTPANLQFPTAANIVLAIPNAQVGQSYNLLVRNSSGSANTATITTNTGITLHGTMTIAQNVTRTFYVTLTSLTAVDVYSLGVSAAAV